MADVSDHRFYYLTNFESALRWLTERYDDLLDSCERGFIDRFGHLPRDARALLVRLIMRRGPLFRQHKIVYPEVDSLASALDALIDLGWVDADPQVSAATVGRLYPKATVALLFGLPPRLSKVEMLSELEIRFSESRCASEFGLPDGERLIHVQIAPLCEQLRLLFFGNFYQDWKEFVLTDLGIFKYENVPLTLNARAFQKREHIDAFYALAAARLALHEEVPLDEVLKLIPRTHLEHEWLEERRAELEFTVAREFEREQNFARASELYAQCHYSGARARMLRVLERQERHDDVLELSERMKSEKLSELECEKIARVLTRVTRIRGGNASLPQTSRATVSTFAIELPSWTQVEEGAAEYLRTDDAPVFYVENVLFNGLFGLWCWEAIFAPIAGAFFHPFQSGPADLWAPNFKQRRAELFNRAFESLDRGDYAQGIRETYRAKAGIHNAFVWWGGLTEELIEMALQCIPARHLKCIFERMLTNLESHSNGFPDLVQFFPAQASYRLIEVKGPGDRLQDHQRRWMEYFVKHEIPAAVCRVERAQAVA